MVPWPETMLVADDASPDADAAVDTALRLAAATGARLSVLHVKSLSPYVTGDAPSPAYREQARAEGEAFMAQRLEQIRRQGGAVDRHWVRLARSIEREIVRLVEAEGFDLLVVPKRGQSYPQRRALGDMSLHLVRDAPCSVLVVRASQLPPDRRRLASTQPREDER
jgi:nucleotide-binding universal stress UspA family protein